MSEPPFKKLKTEDYVLYYWPGIPGRGEYVRLVFEYAGVEYTEQSDPASLLPTITDPTKASHPPAFAPPALKLPSGRFISQTGAILNHLAPKFGLAGEKDGEDAEEQRSVVNSLVLTALDLGTEAHDVHHPVAVEKYYHDQKDAALQRAESFRKFRIPKFLKYFQSVLTSNPDTGDDGSYLVGEKTTTADLTLFQVLSGISYAFPKRLATLRASGDYANVFKLKDRVESEKGIKEYITSGKRLSFNENGIFRHYPELDADE
ncbi:glutathione S-transferase C-terminal-like protein [Cristinia sonorae]|uniref:Glutathione S-transferase C-terminal-like protein n=1 Tax=Cristinia sonorae TaxID=1940300 RepID=A0A8K0US37_9AGAR|nr:glutathione S-transferase C-terminal-like protein [Cristinia sonorae]